MIDHGVTNMTTASVLRHSRPLHRAAQRCDRCIEEHQTTEGRVHLARLRYGETLRSVRRDAGISLRAFAKQLGCSPAMLSDLERGRRWSAPLVAKAVRWLEK
jgi:predicted transcriptional regulator